jgi:hypothetical protein
VVADDREAEQIAKLLLQLSAWSSIAADHGLASPFVARTITTGHAACCAHC